MLDIYRGSRATTPEMVEENKRFREAYNFMTPEEILLSDKRDTETMDPKYAEFWGRFTRNYSNARQRRISNRIFK